MYLLHKCRACRYICTFTFVVCAPGVAKTSRFIERTNPHENMHATYILRVTMVFSIICYLAARNSFLGKLSISVPHVVLVSVARLIRLQNRTRWHININAHRVRRTFTELIRSRTPSVHGTLTCVKCTCVCARARGDTYTRTYSDAPTIDRALLCPAIYRALLHALSS